MGAPWFKIRHLEDEAGLVALSANFALYGDMSDRMMSLAAGLGHNQEVYSIDESFVDLSGIPGDLVRRARTIRKRIHQWIGIPTCIGIARMELQAISGWGGMRSNEHQVRRAPDRRFAAFSARSACFSRTCATASQ
jgi:nucleotidyltransferase/DNA polymerase involved in DNA repair